ncbi:MAG: cobalamin B12-binding domain-containing protein, partial [Acidobacteria bacterium]
MVILYNPVSSPLKKPVLPFSLLAPAALLEHEGIPYQLIDGNLMTGSPLETLDRAVRERDAKILAMTVMPGPQLIEAVPLSREIKRCHPRLMIVWGGYFPSQHY